ncbi:MAG: outer membrane beta-barrel protein [Planctomycetaceae bacterium]|nr:outer membrane beta-barrel protein [Planctomycetaceae bacterium]
MTNPIFRGIVILFLIAVVQIQNQILLAQYVSTAPNNNFPPSAPSPPQLNLQQYAAAATTNQTNFTPPNNTNFYSTTANPYGNAVYGNYPAPNVNTYIAGNGTAIPPAYFAQSPQIPYYAYPMLQYPYGSPPYGYANGGNWEQHNPYNNPYDSQNAVSSEEITNSPNYSTKNSEYSQYMPLRSPLLETGWQNLKLLSPFNAPDGPHRGVGRPLEDESWLDRPYYFGVFCGKVYGTKLVKGQIDQKSGENGGVVLGWNIDHYWGVESRLLCSSISIRDVSNSVTPVRDRSNKITTLDAAIHYYPYGEAKWRPYMKIGLGYVHERFQDNLGVSRRVNTWEVPCGFGLKYWWSDRVNVYAEVADNIILGRDMTTTHSNWAFNFGVNFSFGTNPNAVPTIYWPQSPGR